jgi:hypothetical protein
MTGTAPEHDALAARVHQPAAQRDSREAACLIEELR